MSEWRDISTAPKDGRWLLTYSDASTMGEARWDKGAQKWMQPFVGHIDANLTHWMPLPDPPAPSPESDQ